MTVEELLTPNLFTNVAGLAILYMGFSFSKNGFLGLGLGIACAVLGLRAIEMFV